MNKALTFAIVGLFSFIFSTYVYASYLPPRTIKNPHAEVKHNADTTQNRSETSLKHEINSERSAAK